MNPATTFLLSGQLGPISLALPIQSVFEVLGEPNDFGTNLMGKWKMALYGQRLSEPFVHTGALRSAGTPGARPASTGGEYGGLENLRGSPQLPC